MPRRVGLITGVLALMWSALVFACWDEASARYHVNPQLLYAIAKCESGLRPSVVNRSHSLRGGTYDIGLMQINSSNLRRLKAYGITETQLYDACTNIQVGAWILAGAFQKYGFSWEAVGAYNAACTRSTRQVCAATRSRYAWCVYKNLAVPFTPANSEAHSSSHVTVPEATPIIASRVAP